MKEVYKDSGLGKWFGAGGKGGTSKGGWDRYNTKGEKIGKCGDSKPGEGKPKCLSATKARKLKAQGGKKAIANAVKTKKSQDPQTVRPGTGNKPINVSNRIDKDPKKKGKIRSMLARTRVKKNLTGKGLGFDPKEKGLRTVYDMALARNKVEDCYRHINTNIEYLKLGGIEYKVYKCTNLAKYFTDDLYCPSCNVPINHRFKNK